tara:strand:- start:45 stop:659 length:615 start_codon:yes stop_codon:yes gene_type:complete
VEEKKDLWELVRKKLEKTSIPESLEFEENEPIQLTKTEKIKDGNTGNENLSMPNNIEFKETIIEHKKNGFLNQGIFAGFVYILTIMIVLGILMIPGSITAAIGGYFGGRKSGDPARALTAAMLPFLIIASISVMASIGALPPGSGPNDLSETIGDYLGYNPDGNLLGPISKMPDSNSSVFLSLVAFGFIGGLVEIDKKNKLLFN